MKVFLNLCIVVDAILRSKEHNKSDDLVNNLNPTEDGEASKKSNRFSNEFKLGLQSHLLVLLPLVVGGRVKEDLNGEAKCVSHK